MIVTVIQIVSSSIFIGEFKSNNNIFFIGKDKIRIARLECTYNKDFDSNTKLVTIQARMYAESYRNSRSILFCGQGYFWDDLNKLETNIFINVCKHSYLNVEQEHGIANSSIEWPTDEQLQHNSSLDSDPDDCTFTMYADIANDLNYSKYIPADLRWKYSNYNNAELQGYIVSQDCGITFTFDLKENIPKFEYKYMIFSNSLSVLMLALSLLCMNWIKTHSTSDYVVLGHSVLGNLDVFGGFSLLLYSSISYIYIGFKLEDQVKEFIIPAICGVLSLVTGELSAVLLFRQRFILSHRSGSVWITGLLLILFLTIMIVLNYFFIQVIHSIFHSIILAASTAVQVLRIAKSVYARKNMQYRLQHLIGFSCYGFLEELFILLTIQFVAGRDNQLYYDEIGIVIPVFLGIYVCIFACQMLCSFFLTKSKSIKICTEINYLPEKFLSTCMCEYPACGQAFYLLPVHENVKLCHNPYHTHSSLFGKQQLMQGLPECVTATSVCVCLCERQAVDGQQCAFCFERLHLACFGRLFNVRQQYVEKSIYKFAGSPPLFGQAFQAPRFQGFGATGAADASVEAVEEAYAAAEEEFSAQRFVTPVFKFDGFEGGLRFNLPAVPLGAGFGVSEHHIKHVQLQNSILIAQPPECKEATITILKCGHVFHSACLHGWIAAGNVECPLCRDRIIQGEH